MDKQFSVCFCFSYFNYFKKKKTFISITLIFLTDLILQCGQFISTGPRDRFICLHSTSGYFQGEFEENSLFCTGFLSEKYWNISQIWGVNFLIIVGRQYEEASQWTQWQKQCNGNKEIKVRWMRGSILYISNLRTTQGKSMNAWHRIRHRKKDEQNYKNSA